MNTFNRFRNAAYYLAKKNPAKYNLKMVDNELRLGEDNYSRYRKTYIYSMNDGKLSIKTWEYRSW